MNEPIQSKMMDRAFDASTIYLKCIDDAINEAESNLAKLKNLRGHIKNNILGENKEGLSKVLSDAGPAIPSSQDDAAAVKAMEDALKNTGD